MIKHRIPINKIVLSNAIAATVILASSLSPTSERLSAAETPVETAIVTIQGFQFQPAEIVLKQGGTVTFINKDSTPHTATPTKDAKFVGTGRLKRNEEQTVTFDELGIQDYFCEIHPSMKGMVKVVP